jgi:hypothetical protein
MVRSDSSLTMGMWRALCATLCLFLPLAACSDGSPTGGTGVVQLQLGATFSEAALAYSQAVRYDSVQAVATDPAGAVVGARSVPVLPEATTVDLDLEVQLSSSVELITVTIRLWSTDLLALEGSSTFTVDANEAVTTAPTITLIPVAPLIEINPGTIELLSRGPNPAATEILVGNAGGGMLTWSATADVPWLSLSVPSGSTASGATSPLTLTVDASSLAENVYSAMLTMTAPGAVGAPALVPVTLTVVHTPALGASVSTLSFTAPEQASVSPQPLTITNEGGGTMDWTAQVDQQWLSLSATSGSLAGGEGVSVNATVSSTTLAPGNYAATIQLSSSNASNSPLTIPVALTVSAVPRWNLQVGATGFGSGTVMSSPSGISCSISNGGATGACSADFIEGNIVTLTANGGVGETLGAWGGACSGSGLCQVTMTGPTSVTAGFVTAPPTVGVSPSSLTFTLQQFSGSGLQSVTVTNVGGGVLYFTAIGDQPGLSVVPSTGSLSAGQSTLIDVIAPSDTSQGTYSAKVLVANVADTTNTVTVDVTLNIIPCTTSCGGGPAPDSAMGRPRRQSVGPIRIRR